MLTPSLLLEMAKVYYSQRISFSQARTLQEEQGWKIIQNHAHTVKSYDVIHPRNRKKVLRLKAIAQRIDGLTITDHEIYASGLKEPLVNGGEITIRIPQAGHCLHMGVAWVPDDFPLRELKKYHSDGNKFVEKAKQEGILVDAKHILYPPDVSVPNIRGIREFCREHSIPYEINEKRGLLENMAISWFGQEDGLPLIAASDTHTQKLIPALNVAPGKTLREAYDNIWAGKGKAVMRSAGPEHVTMAAKYVWECIEAQNEKHYGENLAYAGPLDFRAQNQFDWFMR